MTITGNTGFTITGTATRNYKLGTATYTLSGTQAQWNTNVTTNLTYAGSNATIAFTGAGTSVRRLWVDAEVIESLKFHLRDLAVTFRFGEEVSGVSVSERGTVTTLASGKKIPAETVMYSAGRQGVTDQLAVERAGLEVDDRGRLKVDEHFRTAVPHIYAVGDVIGFPALAATSMEQGRQAAYHAFGEPVQSMTAVSPFGIYTIPEVSYCGATEAELTEQAVPYEVGISRYRELARGQIVGDDYGMLKLLVSPDTHALLGVHVFGTSATELIHIGQAIMGCGGTVDYLVDAVLNFPTLSEAYKVAALDATNKIRALEQFA